LHPVIESRFTEKDLYGLRISVRISYDLLTRLEQVCKIHNTPMLMIGLVS